MDGTMSNASDFEAKHPKFCALFYAGCVAVTLGVPLGALYIALHFVIKFW